MWLYIPTKKKTPPPHNKIIFCTIYFVDVCCGIKITNFRGCCKNNYSDNSEKSISKGSETYYYFNSSTYLPMLLREMFSIKLLFFFISEFTIGILS